MNTKKHEKHALRPSRSLLDCTGKCGSAAPPSLWTYISRTTAAKRSGRSSYSWSGISCSTNMCVFDVLVGFTMNYTDCPFQAAASTIEKSASQARIFDSNERSTLTRNTIKAGTTHCWNGVAAHSSELRTCDLELPRGHATVKCGELPS